MQRLAFLQSSNVECFLAVMPSGKKAGKMKQGKAIKLF